MRIERKKLLDEIKTLDEKRNSSQMELFRQQTIREKKDLIRKMVSEEQIIQKELQQLEEKRKELEIKNLDYGKIDEKYDSVMLEIEEISSRTEEDIDTTLLYKDREKENLMNIIKHSTKDLDELGKEISDLYEQISLKNKSLVEKEKQEEELSLKFKKLFEERDILQEEVQALNFDNSENQTEIRQVEDQINYLNIGKARFDAEKESLEIELSEFKDVELIQGSVNYLQERMQKSQEQLREIGNINMRALEVYDEVKKEYDVVQEKVMTLEQEKNDILLIITEIDKKKKTSFMRTFRAINDLFTSNFSQLYTKGVAYLELENKEDIFAGGVNIVVKLSKGKYFDVTSLSGGEQTLVALSLLFSIQEHKPYHFYIFDEIDAALDKRNSERLSHLLEQYMKSGQYIVITHNDAIITNSNILYGVSMHDGISKVLSLKLDDGPLKEQVNEQVVESIKEVEAIQSVEPMKEEVNVGVFEDEKVDGASENNFNGFFDDNERPK